MKDRAISLNAAIEAIYSCAVGGKKYIENAPMSDHFAEGLYDAVSAIEDLPSVTPCEDAISRQSLLELMGEEPFNWTDSDKEVQAVEDYRNFKNMVEQLPSVKPQYTADEIQKIQDLEQAEIQKAYELGKAEAGQFAKWVATEIFDDMWEYNKDAFAEIACRKLEKLGIVRAKGDEWELVEPQENGVCGMISDKLTTDDGEPDGTGGQIFCP